MILVNYFFSTVGQEKDEKDNNATASVSVKRDVAMEMTGYIVYTFFNNFNSSLQ